MGKCSNSGEIIDPDNYHDYEFKVTKLNQFDEVINGYVLNRQYYKITKVNTHIYNVFNIIFNLKK